MVDWYMRMLLDSCLTEILLAKGRLGRGQESRLSIRGRDLEDRGAHSGRRSLWEVSSRVAMAQA